MPEQPSAAATVWRRSARCVSDHHCVEVAEMTDGVGMRNSTRPEVALVFSRAAWRALIDSIKAGELGAGRLP